ncbi:energy transducer TonB [Algibacillus agarilyticus]|uniref:energy transducer TonB n=1 Tax=Algibacillus agarilyticus TaxID=2234133 RepID=UPI000DCF666A|nr:energy transducer TonB [Algibacillus agarilyticus]
MTTIQLDSKPTLHTHVNIQPAFIKFSASVILGVISAFSLFVLMQTLITQDEVNIVADPTVKIGDFVFVKPIEKTIVKPDPRPKLKPPVKAPVKQTATADPIDIDGVSTIENIAIDVVTTTSGTDWTGPEKTDDDASPIVRVAPRYPMKAAQQGIEGWVKLRFSINKLGGVEDIDIIDSQPKRTFDREAQRALARWKYQPKILNGEAIKQTGLSVQLDFSMQ